MGNIFDEASKQGAGKRFKKKGDVAKTAPVKQAQPVQAPPPPPPVIAPRKPLNKEDEDLRKQIRRVEAMKIDLDRQIDDVIYAASKNNLNLSKLFQHVAKDRPEDMRIVGEVLTKAEKVLGRPLEPVKQRHSKKTDAELTSQLKSKMRGARQKWLPMQ
jgi:hypothetical protein